MFVSCCSYLQVVLYVSQMYWTLEVHEALNNDGNDGLKHYLSQLRHQVGNKPK